jgi:glycosyltransferase involved in cell wall biosynthesis
MTTPSISVLHVVNACADGSISRIIERIISHSDKKEFDWHICSVKDLGDFALVFEQIGAKVVDVSPRPGEIESTHLKIKKYIRNNHIQVVHSHTPRTIMEAWRALKGSGRVQQTDALHLATKHLLTSPKDRKWGWFVTIFDRFTLYPPDHLVTVSRTMAREVLLQPGISPTKVTAIPNAIPVEKYFSPSQRTECRRELGLREDLIAIGFTGRFSKVKNMDLLLVAFADIHRDYPQTRLVLAGKGELGPALLEQANRLGINQAVIWTGFSSDVPRLLSALDIYIQPSANEGLSLSVLEAMAAEKPVIVTSVGSAEEIIQNGYNGLLIPPGSIAMISALLKLLLDGPEMRYRLAKNGKEFVNREYNIRKMVDGYYEVYRKLCRRN